MKKRIGIIGATGSIGSQAIDVITRNLDRFDVRFITAHTNRALLEQLGAKVNAAKLLLTSENMPELLQLIDDEDIDLALVGASGTSVINVAYKLAKKGITLALANKECIVAAGKFMIDAVERSGGNIIPVDSEHSALFQCIHGHCKDDIAGLTLTASGGAFRDLPVDAFANVTVDDALKHPNWSMGKKITIDSATMMNKGLELIEARYLFDVPANMLSVVIHPQSIVHSLVSYKDGSVLAQMGVPDMRAPISYALGYPRRIESGVSMLALDQVLQLTFSPPDMKKYRCLSIAIDVLKSDSSVAMITMNAANEIAVWAFIAGKISFNGIAELVEIALNHNKLSEPKSIEDVLEIDAQVRRKCEELL